MRRRLDTVEGLLDDADRGDRLYDEHVERQLTEGVGMTNPAVVSNGIYIHDSLLDY